MEAYQRLCVLLKAQSILKDERCKRSDMTALNSSLDCDLDMLSDTIFELVSVACKEAKISDYDMSLVSALREIGCADSIENLGLLGFQPCN